MTSEDLPSVIALWRSCEGVGLSEGDDVNGLAAYLTRNPNLSWVALNNERLVGAVMAGHDGRRGFLYHLAVSPISRRRGVGKLLVERALEGLKSAGIPKCHVMVFRDNSEGHRFWDHLGWRLRDDIDVRSVIA